MLTSSPPSTRVLLGAITSLRVLSTSSYVQNIRNNANKKRTPKWARKAGFIDETEENRRKAKNQWSGRCVPAALTHAPLVDRWLLWRRLIETPASVGSYEERLPHSTLEGQDYAEDQIADVIANPTDTSQAGRQPERLWREDDEDYYNEDRRASSLRVSAPSHPSQADPASFSFRPGLQPHRISSTGTTLPTLRAQQLAHGRRQATTVTVGTGRGLRTTSLLRQRRARRRPCRRRTTMTTSPSGAAITERYVLRFYVCMPKTTRC